MKQNNWQDAPKELNRYSLITEKFPREFLLLQGTGCRFRQCIFCDYYDDVSAEPYEINGPILQQVTGQTGVLDVINSGSCTELDSRTISQLASVIRTKGIHTLWLEAHWMYRHELAEFAAQFPGVTVKYRVGAETFDPVLRSSWRKGIPPEVSPQQLAQFFQGVCLLTGLPGQTPKALVRDIELAQKHFEYASLNLFNENSTGLKRDPQLTRWFLRVLYPALKDRPNLEILVDNTDLGVG